MKLLFFSMAMLLICLSACHDNVERNSGTDEVHFNLVSEFFKNSDYYFNNAHGFNLNDSLNKEYIKMYFTNSDFIIVKREAHKVLFFDKVTKNEYYEDYYLTVKSLKTQKFCYFIISNAQKKWVITYFGHENPLKLMRSHR